MDNQTAIGIIQTTLNALEPQVAALRAALDVLQNGFKSDLAAAQAQVQPELDEATAKLATAQADLATAQDANVALQTANTDLQTQVTTSQTVATVAESDVTAL